jgi:hypothetical protein
MPSGRTPKLAVVVVSPASAAAFMFSSVRTTFATLNSFEDAFGVDDDATSTITTGLFYSSARDLINQPQNREKR